MCQEIAKEVKAPKLASVKCVQVEVVLRTSFDVFSDCKKNVHSDSLRESEFYLLVVINSHSNKYCYRKCQYGALT